MFKHILIAVDDSADSYKAAEMGLKLAKTCKARVTFVYVITIEYIKSIYGDEKKIRKTNSPFDDFLLEQARTEEIGNRVFSKVIELAHKHDYVEHIETKMLEGNPSAELVNEICTGPYDLAVVGRSGASKAQKSIFGDVTSPVIKLTKIPVLIVNQ